jgi:hypothetical protein
LPGWTLPEPDLLCLLQALHEKKLLVESIPLMVEYLARHPEKAALIRLKLAQILLTEQPRPAQALKVLAKIDEAALEVRHLEFLGRLRAKAQQLHEQDPYEVADQDW